MKINSDINVLGGLPDWNLIRIFLHKNAGKQHYKRGLHTVTAIKTDKSVKRFQKAINSTLLKFSNPNIRLLITEMIESEGISSDLLYLLFWNASYNNDLLHYLNEQIYFISFFSGRITIKQNEVVACLKDLKEREIGVKKWSESTLDVTASKYLTLLKKFHLMEGSLSKTIIHPYLNDRMFVMFVYWLSSLDASSNLLENQWLKYSFSERSIFLERLMQKKFSRYFQFTYTGDALRIETLISYSDLYHAIK